MATQQRFHNTGIDEQSVRHPQCQFKIENHWLDLRYDENGTIIKPDELEKEMEDPPKNVDDNILNGIHGSMIGMALGDALGAHVEFRPRQFLLENPVKSLEGGGTWGLKKGQFTDDTSMALCLAISLVARQDYVPYDQLVRYKWWYRHGYMSSTGQCFDIGSATKKSLAEFERRQKKFADEHNIPLDQLDFLSDRKLLKKFVENCSEKDVAGNGALMRLAPVPLFFHQHPIHAVEYSGLSGLITHGDPKVYDACRYYGALIVAAVNGATKEELIDENFYDNHKEWFGNKPFHPDIKKIAKGSYKEIEGYDKGIRGKGYIVSALEAALWAFWSDEGSFKKGVLAAVNLGDDTDTTAAIYGQLAGAHYGYKGLPQEWVTQVYAKDFIKCLSKWIAYEGMHWPRDKSPPLVKPLSDFDIHTRPRRGTVHEPSNILKPPGSNVQPATSRPKSAERKDESRERIYNLKDLKTPDDVYRWFKPLGDEFKTYADIFKKKNIDGYWLLNHIDHKALEKLGITREDHQHFIVKRIEDSRKECPVTFATKS